MLYARPPGHHLREKPTDGFAMFSVGPILAAASVDNQTNRQRKIGFLSERFTFAGLAVVEDREIFAAEVLDRGTVAAGN